GRDQRGSKEANLSNVGSETTGPTSPCVRQSSRLISSADHLICQEEQGGGHRHPERLGRLEVNDQFEFRGLLHGQVGGLGAFQDLVHIGGSAVPAIENVRPVVHEPPGLGIPHFA